MARLQQLSVAVDEDVDPTALLDAASGLEDVTVVDWTDDGYRLSGPWRRLTVCCNSEEPHPPVLGQLPRLNSLTISAESADGQQRPDWAERFEGGQLPRSEGTHPERP